MAQAFLKSSARFTSSAGIETLLLPIDLRMLRNRAWACSRRFLPRVWTVMMPWVALPQLDGGLKRGFLVSSSFFFASSSAFFLAFSSSF
jgi:hypothetical protein